MVQKLIKRQLSKVEAALKSLHKALLGQKAKPAPKKAKKAKKKKR